jgi:hypothetical protein
MMRLGTEILDQATGCEYQFACLEGDPNELCEVDFFTADNFVFLRSSTREPSSCKYWFEFGESGICKCPVRVELFRRYNV